MKRAFAILILSSLLFALSGCAIFKKNKCQECPKWNKIENQEKDDLALCD